MNKTKQEKWQRAYGDTPDSFRQRVAASLPKGEESRHVAFPRRAMVLAAALVLVLTTAYAAVVTHTELVWNAGHPIENEADDRLGLLTGEAGTSGDPAQRPWLRRRKPDHRRRDLHGAGWHLLPGDRAAVRVCRHFRG